MPTDPPAPGTDPGDDPDDAPARSGHDGERVEESSGDRTDPGAGGETDRPDQAGPAGTGGGQDQVDGEETATDPADAEPAATGAVDDGAFDRDTTAEDDGDDIPEDVRKYDRFQKIDGGTYDRANEFLRERTYITAREWAIARLCADFRTETGVEMTKIGQNLPTLVPFMTDTYSPQAVNQARSSFEEKVTKAGATFLYGAMSDFFTASEIEDLMYEVTEVAKFLLEVEGVDLSVEDELAVEDRISSVMRDVRESSAAIRYDHVECPECGHEIEAREDGHSHDDPAEADD